MERRRSSMKSGRGGRGRNEEVVKEKNYYSKERRLEVLEPVYDAQGQTVRFERCAETLPNGSRKLLLLKRAKLAERDISEWYKDLEMWSQLRHTHILQYDDSWETPHAHYLLSENAQMCLSVCLRDMAPSKPHRTLYPQWLFHIVSALEYMHERNNENRPMLHRNLQPDNILVTDHCVLKLCAFGTAKRLDSAHGKTGTVFGRADLFQSPEIAEGQPYDQSTDIWSFGVTAAYIADYDSARKSGSAEKLLRIMKESGQKEDTQAVVTGALQRDPVARPKASDIVQHLQQNFKDWLQSPPTKDLFPQPLCLCLELTDSTSSHANSTDDPSLCTETGGSRVRPPQNFSQSEEVVTPDAKNRRAVPSSAFHTEKASSQKRSASGTSASVPVSEKQPIVRSTTDCTDSCRSHAVDSASSTQSVEDHDGSDERLPENCETLLKTAENTTQTSFYDSALDSAKQTAATQTSQKRKSRRVQVIIIKATGSRPQEPGEVGSYGPEVFQNQPGNIAAQLVSAVSPLRTRPRSESSRHRQADMRSSTPNHSHSTAATASATSPPTTTTPAASAPESSADSSDMGSNQEALRKQLQKIHEEPSDPRTQPTPRRHGQHRNRTHPGSHKNSRECSGPSRHAGSREGSRSDSQADHRENSRSTSHADDREGSRSAGHRHNRRIHADNGRIHTDNGRIHADNGRDSKALVHRDSIEDTGSSGETDGSGESASTADTDCTGDSRGTRHRNKRPPESRTDSRAVPRTELAITPEALQMLDCVLNRIPREQRREDGPRRPVTARRTPQERGQPDRDSNPQRCVPVRARTRSDQCVRPRRDPVDHHPRRHRPREDETDDTSGFFGSCDSRDLNDF